MLAPSSSGMHADAETDQKVFNACHAIPPSLLPDPPLSALHFS